MSRALLQRSDAWALPASLKCFITGKALHIRWKHACARNGPSIAANIQVHGGEGMLLDQLDALGMHCDANTQLVVLCEVCIWLMTSTPARSMGVDQRSQWRLTTCRSGCTC